MTAISGFVTSTLFVLAALFVFAVGIGVLAVILLYVLDVTQTKHAIRRNFPVIGRLRYLFEHLGEFFRQYFFAMDREELPFNRAQRSWVYRAAKNVDNTVPFGSTRDIRPVGTVLFVSTPYATLEEDSVPAGPITIGAGCRYPYTTSSLFNISAMSFGAISMPAVTALSRGAAMAGCWLNTGEGGLSTYHLEGGADIVFQIGTAKFGVRDADGRLDEARLRKIAEKPQVKMFELKISQGAKPGKGGILPGIKVTPEIAEMRGIPVGHDAISPNRHHEIASTADLLEMLHRIRDVTGKPTGFKAVIGDPDWIDEICAEVARRGEAYAPDFITVDSKDGGTGAAPMSLMDFVGLPISESLPQVVDSLTRHGLKERIKVIASGKLVTPGAAAWALCAGADFVQSARGFMFALGCIQAMQCHRNTCPTGVTTHDPRLQEGLDVTDKAERVMHYAQNMVHEIGIIAHSVGVTEPHLLRRHHCRIVGADGRSVRMDRLYPEAGPPA